MSRIRPGVHALSACVAVAGLVAGCGNLPGAPNAPDIQTLPSPIATVPPPSIPDAAPPSRPQRDAADPGGVPAVGAGAQFRPIGGDDFDGGSLNTRKWGTYNSIGGFGYGLRRPSAIGVSGGSLVITASDEVSGGMADSFGQVYGRWEFRARTDRGRGYGSAILLWPDSEKLSDGEIDIAEVPSENRDMVHWVLHSGPGGDTLDGWHMNGDFSQWHTFAVDWLPDHITWYVDGVARYTVRDRAHIPHTPMHLAIQLDQGPVKDWMPAPDATTPDKILLQVDWVRVYSWVGARGARATRPAGAPRPRPTAPTKIASTKTAPTPTMPTPTPTPTTTKKKKSGSN